MKGLVILSAVLLVWLEQNTLQAAEVRCASSAANWCLIAESANVADGETLTILNSEHRDRVKQIHWSIRSNMKTIPAAIFETFPNLLVLDINTGIEQLTPSDFEKATLLDNVELNKNNLRRLPANVFPKAPKLTTIEITSNQIAEIEDNAFNGMNLLETLTLTYNFITTLKRNTFTGAPKLRQIDLRFNEITTIEPGTFDLPRLDDIDLGVNHLKTMSIPAELFNNAPLLDSVDFAYNEMTEIPAALHKKNVVVESLVMDYNPLENFEFSELLKIKTLTYVSLENTGIVLDNITAPQIVSKSLLDNIDLSANAITTPNILKHLAMFGNLETITLDSNKIHHIDDMANIKTMFPNITGISLLENEVDCAWLREVLPAMKSGEIELTTGEFDEDIPAEEQGESVDDHLCGPLPGK